MCGTYLGPPCTQHVLVPVCTQATQQICKVAATLYKDPVEKIDIGSAIEETLPDCTGSQYQTVRVYSTEEGTRKTSRKPFLFNNMGCISYILHTYIHTYTHTYLHVCIHTYIHIYIHTYIRTYIRAHILTYSMVQSRS